MDLPFRSPLHGGLLRPGPVLPRSRGPVVLRSKRDVEVRHRKRDREILSLAWPAVLGASIDPVLSLLDTYWVSRCLGMVALAALGPALNVEDWMFDILKTVQVPVRSLTSEAVAAKKPQDVLQTLTQALCFCWRVGLVVALMGSVLAPLLLRLSSVEASSPLLEPAKAYLVPRLWGSPGLLTLIVLQATLSGAFRDTTAVLRLVLLGAFLNAVLTPLAVVGMHGGTAGAAWATTVSCYASAVCAWIMVARRPGGPWLPQPRKLFATAFLGKEVEGESKGWGKLLAANAAMTLRSFSSLTTWLVACSIITKIGVAPLAAHTCMTKTFLSFLYWMYGFQLASQVLVSADVAKGLPRRARWTALRAMRMAMLVASATALALWVGRESIAAALVRDLLVIQSFETLVPPAMAMLLIYGAMWVAEGVLYGLGDYAWAAKCTSFAASAAILVMLLLSWVQPTAPHIWWSLNVLMSIRAIFGLHRAFFSKRSPLSSKAAMASEITQ